MGSYKKKLFIVLLLILLIGFFVCGSVNAATPITENYEYNIDLINIARYSQEYRSSIFFHYLEKSNITDSQKETLKGYFKNYFVYFRIYASTSGNNVYNLLACFYPKNTNYNQLSLVSSSYLQTEESYIYDPYYEYNVSGYNVDCIRVYVDTFGGYYTTGNASTFIPTFCIGYEPSKVSNFVNDLPIDNGGLWAMLVQSVKDNTEEQEEQTEEMKKLNNFMSSEDVDEDAYDMPSDNPTQDITESGVNGIFTMFYDKIDNWESENITIRIPFANKIFIIPSDLTENIINSYFPSNTQFGRLLGLIWYYLLGVYIVKDIQKYIDGLQTGEILTKSDTNIKTEML